MTTTTTLTPEQRRALALGDLRQATERLRELEAAQNILIWFALGIGCPLRQVAEAAGVTYDALRMRRTRARTEETHG